MESSKLANDFISHLKKQVENLEKEKLELKEQLKEKDEIIAALRDKDEFKRKKGRKTEEKSEKIAEEKEKKLMTTVGEMFYLVDPNANLPEDDTDLLTIVKYKKKKVFQISFFFPSTIAEANNQEKIQPSEWKSNKSSEFRKTVQSMKAIKRHRLAERIRKTCFPLEVKKSKENITFLFVLDEQFQ
jgi:hypothetical protein